MGPVSLIVSARARLRGRLLPIAHTALAAVAAWLLAGLLVNESRPAFAAIAAVISVGMTFGQRGERAVHLTGGVVLGICAADLMAHVIGVGPAQLGLLVVIAMLAAVVLGGSELLIVESAVSAILLVTLDPAAGGGFSIDRILEAMIGGASALAVGDADAAQLALGEARAIDPLVAEVHESLAASRDASRLAPRPDARVQLERYDRSLAQLDFAVRNTRVLARSALRLVRAGGSPGGLDEAVSRLGGAVWELAGAYDDPRRADAARRLAAEAAARATEAHDHRPDLAHTELVGTVRSTAVDLMRAADLVSDTPVEQPTEELLAIEV